MDKNTCEHKFVHLETIRKTEWGSWATTWVVIDRFFCEKCLCEEETRKEKFSREKPEWY